MRSTVIGTAGLVMALLTASPAQAEGVFAGLSGRWVGGGKIIFNGGKTESLQCRVTYIVGSGASSANQGIRCASASTTFVVKAVLSAEGGKISGSWNESIHNVSGSVAGKGSAGTFAVNISSSNFTGSMAVNTSGASQSVVIKPTGNTVDRISLSLRKG
jgi:hypothetical protein